MYSPKGYTIPAQRTIKNTSTFDAEKDKRNTSSVYLPKTEKEIKTNENEQAREGQQMGWGVGRDTDRGMGC